MDISVQIWKVFEHFPKCQDKIVEQLVSKD